MKYYQIEPEVAGGFGPNTSIERIPGQMLIVKKLHYKFDDWLGDDLLATSPCFIVSERLALEIDRANLTGVTFDEVETSMSEDFIEFKPSAKLPRFIWLKIIGKPGVNDFGLAFSVRLIISERAYGVFQRFNIQYADIEEFDNKEEGTEGTGSAP